MSAPLPITLLTGFLGSGKTTLLARALRDARHARSAVIVNELSHLGVDGALLETGPGQLVRMTTGCICCSAGGDAVAALADLARRVEHYEIGPFERVLVETTGMADPSPVVPSLMLDRRVSAAFRLTHIVTTVDVVHGARELDRFEEARRQVGFADRIALTKTDLIADPASRQELGGLEARLRRLNPAAEIIDVHAAQNTAAQLLDCDRLWRDDAAAGRWLAARGAVSAVGGAVRQAPRHDPRIVAIGIEWSEPVEARRFLEALRDLLISRLGKILRIKGIVRTIGDPSRPLVVHAVDDALGEPVRLERWPGAEGAPGASRLVAIGEGLSEAELRGALGLPPFMSPAGLVEVRP